MFGKLNMAIIGTGRMASVMAETVRKVRGVRLYAVASRDASRASEFGEQHGIKKMYGSYEELAEDSKVNFVYIATPHSEHFENAKLFLEHGKHVLMEKAFTINAKQAETLYEIADSHQVLLTEAMWVRFMPMAGTIRDVLDSKVIGEPVMLTANLGYNVRRKQRLIEPALGGGTLLDLGVYPLNFAAMFFGLEISEVHAACTYTSKHLDEQESITLKYPSGKMAVLTATMAGVSDRKGIITGTKGYMIVENINNFESITVYDLDNKQLSTYKRPKQNTGYEYEVEAFAKAVKQGASDCQEMPRSETISIMHLMDEIRRQFGVVYPCEINTVPAIEAAEPEPVFAVPESEPTPEAAEPEPVQAPEVSAPEPTPVFADPAPAPAPEVSEPAADIAPAAEETAAETAELTAAPAAETAENISETSEVMTQETEQMSEAQLWD